MVENTSSVKESDIFSTTHNDGVWMRQYYFTVTDHCTRKIPGNNGVDRQVLVHVYRYVERDCRMYDWSVRTFEEDDDPHTMFFSLSVDTEMSFAQALMLFRSIGVTQNSAIPLLSYGKSKVRNVGSGFLDKLEKQARGEQDLEFKARSEYHAGQSDENVCYHQTPFVVADLDAPFVKDVNEHEGRVFMRINGEKGSAVEEASFFYEKHLPPKQSQEPKRTISYMDIRVVKPRFDQILDAASFKINPAERQLLEEMIERTLRL